MEDTVYPIRTLGERLDEQARRIAARRLPAYLWARPLARLLDHLASLPAPIKERFERIEAPVQAPSNRAPLPSRGAITEPSMPAIYSPPGTEGRPVAPDIQARLREIAGPGAETMRVHDDAAADETALSHRADAVTVGPDVFFRRGQFQPKEPRGLGLLAHEATHVVALLNPGVSWQRATGAGIAAEEAEAQASERRALAPPVPLSRVPGAQPQPGISVARSGNAPPRVPGLSATAAAATATAATAPATLALRPMAAATDRTTEPAAAPTAPIDVEELRRTLVRDLMRQLRTEFERGG